MMPRYPVYVISKGRYEKCMTARFLTTDKVPFALVVEPQEEAEYRSRFPDAVIHVLPFANLGQGSIPARNWVWEHAKAGGHERHWIMDDNLARISRRANGFRVQCDAGPALAACESFVERYANVAIAGLNYEMFVADGQKAPPFRVNHRVYSCLLIRNDLPFRWRGRYNEDTDLCLQVLSAGWCTILFNAFMVWKLRTMAMKGGNTDELYAEDGRLKMARSLERMWPGVVTVIRRYNRPQHLVDWNKFDHPLIRREDVEVKEGTNEHGMRLVASDGLRNEHLQQMVRKAEGKA